MKVRRCGDFQSNGFENRKIFEPRSLFRHQGLNLAALPFANTGVNFFTPAFLICLAVKKPESFQFKWKSCGNHVKFFMIFLNPQENFRDNKKSRNLKYKQQPIISYDRASSFFRAQQDNYQAWILSVCFSVQVLFSLRLLRFRLLLRIAYSQQIPGNPCF